MSFILENLRLKKPASVEICSLLFKPDNLQIDLSIKYVGFKIPRDFVIGYGLDYEGLYRNVPYIAIFKDK